MTPSSNAADLAGHDGGKLFEVDRRPARKLQTVGSVEATDDTLRQVRMPIRVFAQRYYAQRVSERGPIIGRATL